MGLPSGLPSKRGGQKPNLPLSMVMVRELNVEDVGALSAPGGPGVPTIRSIRGSHHRLAQMLAKGMAPTEVSLVSGYSVAWISSLKGDPAFAELLAHYQSEREEVFIDVAERMKEVGLQAVEELQERLVNEPEKFSPGALLDVVDTMLLKGRAGPGSSQGAGASYGGGASGVPLIQIEFVSPTPSGPVIDG